MEKYNRNSVFTELEKYDHLAKEYDYIEVCEWHNGEGFDVSIGSPEKIFSLTCGQFDALKKVIKKLEK